MATEKIPQSDANNQSTNGETDVANVDDIREALRAVYDPEIGINIVDLGLVYGVENNDGDVKVIMTLTSPACPLGPVIVDQVTYTAGRVPGVENVGVEFVWSPPWDPRTMCSEEAKAELGIW
ncbi:MAG TPA: metal-sulfur cluster assembly factor [Chloroflexota bacterium]|nr:metal-sulfur cluster assembly factor [Chloroflexota bacterium]